MPDANLPGFRRRFLITPSSRAVTAALEDDIHRMAVTLHHDGESVTRVEAEMARHPWDLCPGAVAKVEADFAGRPLAPSAGSVDKKANCTHLFDLAELALRHAGDAAQTLYEMQVSDPEDGRVTAVLRRDGQERLHWHLQDDRMLAPHLAQGLPLIGLRPWIATLAGDERHEARMLQWASLVAHGRQIPWEIQKGLRALPASCFASQPGRHEKCQRIGERIDFSKPGARLPLAD
ncbi:hypothetical protein [Novosphingobium aquae]|uniref:DUF2889 domain-containing protein n=1 Tax=Novosphingobium aquae TaxID=3133435 RepID=A0ABU8S875_9SPHN